MVKQGFRAPSRFELEILKKYQKIEKCPFCGRSMGKTEIMKLKMYKVCKCKKCGKLIKYFDPKIIH